MSKFSYGFWGNQDHLRAVRGDVRRRAAASKPQPLYGAKSLSAAGDDLVARRIVHRMNVCNGLLTKLGKEVDAWQAKCHAASVGCSCDGQCTNCKLDRVQPLYLTIMSEARRANELTKVIEEMKGMDRLSYGIKSLTGAGTEPDAADLARRRQRAELEALRKEAWAAHDTAWRALCDPATGIDPGHPICAETRCFSAAAV
jgi:hypothetical protein